MLRRTLTASVAFLISGAVLAEAPGWATALADGLAEIPGVETVLVARGDAVLVERGTPDEPTNIRSASKSVVSALLGIALQDDVFRSLNQPVAELLPAAFKRVGSPAKRAITLRHLVTMTSGLESTSGYAYGAWAASPSWVDAALAKPLVTEPGTSFSFSTGNTHLVTAALTEASGMSARQFAQSRLFDPLGDTITAWPTDPEGYVVGGNDLETTPRALLHFGQLYLRAGRWKERQVVPRAWVEASTRTHSAGFPDRLGTYGFGWWVRPRNAFMAVGFGGVFLYCDPRTDVAVVVTSDLAEPKGAAWDRRVVATIEDGLPAR